MLHHLPSEALQNRLLAEVARVLRHGGVYAGTDSLYSGSFRLLHLLDTMVVVVSFLHIKNIAFNLQGSLSALGLGTEGPLSDNRVFF